MSTRKILTVKALKKHFPVTKGTFLSKVVGQVKAVSDVSFSLHEGETFGLVGPNGKGKSTLLRMVASRELPVPESMDVLLVE